MSEQFRQGVIVREPFKRLSDDEIQILDKASTHILENLGLQCFNEEAADIFSKNGCTVSRHNERSWLVKIPPAVLREFVSKAPSKVKLGARVQSAI
jgi:trimethylamine:corrinoid methyltransferase-like protein